MRTILERILPYDIADIIYKLYINNKIKFLLCSKLYSNELIMSGTINQFKNQPYNKSLSNLDVVKFNKVINLLKDISEKYIIKGFYKFDNYHNNLITKYIKTIKKMNEYENNNLIKNYIDLSCKKIEIILN